MDDFKCYCIVLLTGKVVIKLSTYDCVALAIAAIRRITLLTGDASLRKTAYEEGVHVLGTIGILEQLFDGDYINSKEYLRCLEDLSAHNGGKVRLPEKELRIRIHKLKRLEDFD